MASGPTDAAVKDEPYHKHMVNVLSFDVGEDAHHKDQLPGEEMAT